MAIQIIDGFQVNTASPIDNRIVASGSTARNAIPYKYEGLRVFDLSDNIPYVYINGAWQSENSTGISGAGTINYLPVYTSGNVVGNSLLYQSGGNLIKTANTGSGADKVIINAASGLVTAVNFSGGGSQITGIDASNISSGNLNLNRLDTTNGTTNWVLGRKSSGPDWINPTQMTVGTASVANSVGVTPNSTNSSYYLTFVGGGSWTTIPGSTNLLSDISGITYNPSTNQLAGISLLNIAAGSAAAPSLSIIGDTNTGIYSPGADSLSVTLGGTEKIKFETNAVTFGEQSSFYPRIRINSTSSATTPSFTWWGNDQTGIFRPASNVVAISTGSTGVERARFADAGVSIGFGTPIKTMYVGRIRFTKTSSSSGSVSVLNGGDYAGTAYTISNDTYNSTTISARVNFPTAMPNSNIIVVCHIDSTSSNHYPWTVICSDRSAAYINLVCIRQDGSAWSTGAVDGSFVAYCV